MDLCIYLYRPHDYKFLPSEYQVGIRMVDVERLDQNIQQGDCHITNSLRQWELI